jgi:hypothetical protein
MNEQRFSVRIRHALDASADAIEPGTARKLRLARERALARVPATSSRLSLAGFGHLNLDGFWPASRAAIALIVLALAVGGVSYWHTVEQAAEYEEIDSALLADDLPINAYLDRGFDAWLKVSAQQ